MSSHRHPLRRRLATSAVASALLAVVAPGCVVKLQDRNSPAENGAVTGPAADCSGTQVLPGGAPGGPAEPKFVGRVAFTNPDGTPAPAPVSPIPPTQAAIFDWSGTQVSIRFQGTTAITAKLMLPGAIPQDQLYEFVVDGSPSVVQVTVKADPNGNLTTIPLEEYEISGLDPAAPHELVIHRNTEAQKGSILFKGFDLHGGTILPPVRRPRRMEFIGDSIVCGYGNEGQYATCPFEVTLREVRNADGSPVLLPNGQPALVTLPVTQNQYLSFTSIAARALDADAVTLCWSGKGVYKNFKERFVLRPDGSVTPEDDTLTTVPQLWDSRTIGNDFQGYPWDFSRERPEEVPQVVFISLGTNDFARDTIPTTTDPTKLPGDNVPDGDMDSPAELQNFFQAYLDFVRRVRARRPSAHIFLATPPMVTDQFPLENARQKLKGVLLNIVTAMNDPRVYQMDLVEQGFRYGLGCDYHPNLAVHRIMADQVIGAVRSKTCW